MLGTDNPSWALWDIALALHYVAYILISSAQWWGYWLLRFAQFFLNVVGFIVFLWPWMVLCKGLDLLNENDVDTMLDYFSSYIERITSTFSAIISRLKGVRKGA